MIKLLNHLVIVKMTCFMNLSRLMLNVMKLLYKN